MMNKLCCKDLRAWINSFSEEQRAIFQESFKLMVFYKVDQSQIVDSNKLEKIINNFEQSLVQAKFMLNNDGSYYYDGDWNEGLRLAKNSMAQLDLLSDIEAKSIYINAYVGCLKAKRGVSCASC